MINQYLLTCAFPHIELKADFSCAESFDFASNIASYLIHSRFLGSVLCTNIVACGYKSVIAIPEVFCTIPN